MLLFNVKKSEKMNIFREKIKRLANHYPYNSLNIKYPCMESESNLSKVMLAKTSNFHHFLKSLLKIAEMLNSQFRYLNLRGHQEYGS